MNALDTEVSALGFGCASLGSRVAPSVGLAALERAYDAGVTWYDVAPSYGDGQAEVLLGRFLANHDRRSIQVLTKVGIAPPQPSPTAQLLRPMMRAAVSAFPGLRAAIRRNRPPARKLALDAALIKQSLEASLRRLGTDYVDVLALHDATPDEVVREDVVEALERVVASGKARSIAIASSPETAAAGVGVSAIYSVVQIGNNLLEPEAKRFLRTTARPVGLVTHSVFGNEGAVSRIAARIETEQAIRKAIVEAGYRGTARQIAADILADYAFGSNVEGVIIVSMFKAEHLHQNFRRITQRPSALCVDTLLNAFHKNNYA
jgi:aryl-alcohol dehydrogenase-like predicted oxidoreductase